MTNDDLTSTQKFAGLLQCLEHMFATTRSDLTGYQSG